MADAHFTQRDLDDARAQARTEAEAELLPFHGVGRVKFPRNRSHFAACRLYERELFAYHRWLLPLVEDARITEHQAAEDDVAQARRGREIVDAAAGSNRVTTTVKRTAARVKTDGARQRSRTRLDEAVLVHHDRLQLLEDVEHELAEVQRWLDVHVDDAVDYSAQREGWRQDGGAPTPGGPRTDT